MSIKEFLDLLNSILQQTGVLALNWRHIIMWVTQSVSKKYSYNNQ